MTEQLKTLALKAKEYENKWYTSHDLHTEPIDAPCDIDYVVAASPKVILKLIEDNENLRTVMMAAAVEITEHWDAHCDKDGYGPANLVRRLENGYPSQYGYDAQTVVRLEKERDELLAENDKIIDLWSAMRAERDELRDKITQYNVNMATEMEKLIDERDSFRDERDRYSVVWGKAQLENEELKAKLAAYESREPAAALVEVRRTEGPWQRYNEYASVAVAEDTKARTDGNGIEVRVVPLYREPTE